MSYNEIVSILSEYKNIVSMESELKKQKEKIAETIKNYMGSDTEKYISEYHIIYKEVSKTVVDTEKLKNSGLYETFSKKQVTRPLSVK